jgi:hypothetical protein
MEMANLTGTDCRRYLKVAVEVTRNYTQAAGHGPMIENIYRALCKLHEQMPEEGEASAAGAPSAPSPQKSQ